MGKITHTTAGRKLTQAEYEADGSHQIEGDGTDIVRSATTIIAASDAPAAWLTGADVVCDGTADEVEINAAIVASGTGQTTLLSPGTFKTSDEVVMNQGGGVLKGTGWHYHTSTGVVTGTQIQCQETMTNSVKISAEECQIKDLWIDGNSKATQFKNEGFYTTISHVGSVNHTTYSLYGISAASGYTGVLDITDRCMFLYKPIRIKATATTIDGQCYFNGDLATNCIILDMVPCFNLIGCTLESFSGSAVTFGEVGARFGMNIIGNYLETAGTVTNVFNFAAASTSIDGFNFTGNYLAAAGTITNFLNLLNGSSVLAEGNHSKKPIFIGTGVTSAEVLVGDWGSVSYNSLTGLTYLKIIESGTRFTGIPEFHYATAPTVGTWPVRSKVWDTVMAAGTIPGWICTTAGTPGTWKEMPPLSI